MTAPHPKGCRYRDPATGYLCRRPERSRKHGPHDDDCTIPSERHHAFVATIQGRESREDDPFVQTSVQLRRSDMAYLHATYGRGRWSLWFRRKIEEERRLKNVAARRSSIALNAAPPLIVSDDSECK